MNKKEMSAVNIGLLGCGTVGSGVYHLIQKNQDLLQEAVGVPVKVKRILVKDPDEPRPFEADRKLMVTEPEPILEDPEIDIMVELIGGTEPALSLILESIKRGKSIVTANKELMADQGRVVLDSAEKAGVEVRFEASVGGGIPIIHPLKENLAGDRIKRILGIMNGTTNYILTRMSEDLIDYDTALREAQDQGYAEADPSADVEGHDAANKLAILASIAFRSRVVASDVYREGIDKVRTEDLEYASELGYSVKLLGIATMDEEGVSVRVHPTMIPASHPLASVRGNFNAIFIEGESVGELMFYGQGAGSLPTATAVLGDIVDVARNLRQGALGVGCTCVEEARIRPIEEITTRYYMVLKAVDRPGVLAQIAKAFGDNNVSLESVVQKGFADEAEITLITHYVQEQDLRRAHKQLMELQAVIEIPSIIRVESG